MAESHQQPPKDTSEESQPYQTYEAATAGLR
jgi:hypothetical protein